MPNAFKLFHFYVIDPLNLAHIFLTVLLIIKDSDVNVYLEFGMLYLLKYVIKVIK